MLFRRIGLALFTLTLAVSSAVPALAQVPQAGGQQWAQDGWLYVVSQGRWQRTNTSRRFPDARNPNVYDVYQNGQLVKRMDVSQRGWSLELPVAHMVQGSLFTWVKYPAGATMNNSPASLYVPSAQTWLTLPQAQWLVAEMQARVNRQGPAELAASKLGGVSTPSFPQGPAELAASRLGGISTPSFPRTAASDDPFRRSGIVGGGWGTTPASAGSNLSPADAERLRQALANADRVYNNAIRGDLAPNCVSSRNGCY